jgi:predicted porin
MKKVLLAGSALLAFGAVTAQAAEPIQLGLSGTIVENFGYVNNYTLNGAGTPAATKLNKFHEQDDGTISIKGSTKLDNGITVAAQWDLYGYSGSQSRSVNSACGRTSNLTGSAATNQCAGDIAIKRAYVTIGSQAGSLILGEREDATYIVHNSAPDVSPLAPIGDGYFYWWVVSPANHRTMTLDNDSRYDDRGNKITYISPSFHGLAAAFTYVPTVSTSAGSGSGTPATSNDFATFIGNGQINGANFGGDAYGGGLAYSDNLRGVGVKGDATVVQANITNLRIYQQGLQLSYGGFTLGGSSMIRDVPSDAVANGLDTDAKVTNALVAAGVSAANAAGNSAGAFAQAAAYAGNTYTIGLSYTTGPYSLSAAYFHDNSKSVRALNGTGKADSTDVYDIGAAYAAGPGVTFRAGVGYVDYRGDVLSTATKYLNNNSGIAALTGVKLDF